MTNLYAANCELVKRSNDERFESLDAIREDAISSHKRSKVIYTQWEDVQFQESDDHNKVCIDVQGSEYAFTNWSISQVCKQHGVDLGTIQKVTAGSALSVLNDTRYDDGKPVQLFVDQERRQLRSIHTMSYTRIPDYRVIGLLDDYQDRLSNPPAGYNGATGLYRGEQDMFLFQLVKDSQFTENGEDFSMGFFLWNSEIGARTLGFHSFSYQHVCGNHIVWDSKTVEKIVGRHNGKVHDKFADIRDSINCLLGSVEEIQYEFADVYGKARTAVLGDKLLRQIEKTLPANEFPQKLLKETVAKSSNLWDLVDGLTRANREQIFAGSRNERDVSVGKLLTLV